MSTARCLGGRCWSAATNASLTVSRDCATSAGSPSGTIRPSGIGSIQLTSGRVERCSATGSPAGPRSIGRARRLRLSSMSKQTFVAIRYSQERSDERPSKRSKLRQARMNVSCTASSASTEPSMR